jgi:hypothetical protein
MLQLGALVGIGLGAVMVLAGLVMIAPGVRIHQIRGLQPRKLGVQDRGAAGVDRVGLGARS